MTTMFQLRKVLNFYEIGSLRQTGKEKKFKEISGRLENDMLIRTNGMQKYLHL